jgi:thiopurine S-methyltransferase
MEPSFWIERWKEGRIGFHEGHPNTFLMRYAERLGDAKRVLVPLCGKAEDMAFLAARGHAVVGVDVALSALRDFFREHGLEPAVETSARLTTLRADAFTLLAGDFLALTREEVGDVDAVYDRAALVALPPELRVRYVALLRALIPAGTPLLIVTFDYPQAQMQGPPFAVGEEELRRLYSGAIVKLLDQAPLGTGKLRDAGIDALEQCWLVTT